jgi:hypothetical protein
MTEYRRSLLRAAATLGVAGAALGFGAVAGYAGSAPHIAVHPRSVMVTKTVVLTGRGFPANTLLRLQECGARSWIVPQEPCDTTNEITVMTGPRGRFTTDFEAQLCPRLIPPKPPVTEETCFLGEPELTGEDTAGLLGAAKMIVTYP